MDKKEIAFISVICIVIGILFVILTLSGANKIPTEGAYTTSVPGQGKWVCVYKVDKWFGQKTENCIKLN